MSKTKTCPKCGTAADGNFCGNCGAAVSTRHCTQCGAKLTDGARFCTQCGSTSVPGVPAQGPSGGDFQAGWWIAGGMMIVLILVFAWPILRPDDVAPVPTAVPAAGPAAVDLSSMTPRQAADRLFERIMMAASAGDSVGAAQFLPMAIQAYDRAAPLDLDGQFHLSTLHRTAGDFVAALATAEQALADGPDHLLLLYAAGEAAREAGDGEAARRHFQRLLDVYDAQMASGNPDYESHTTMMGSIREEASAYLASAG